jgi:hypothetical protein
MAGFKDSMIDFGLGAGGAIVYSLISSLLGSGLIGGLVGAGIAGSVIKGTRGTVLATTLGFNALLNSFGNASNNSSAEEVM